MANKIAPDEIAPKTITPNSITIEAGKASDVLVATVMASQTNALGHLKAAQYIVLFDDAFMALFIGLGVTDADLRHGATSPFLADLRASYLRELRPGTRIVVAAEVLDVAAKRLRLLLRMTDTASGQAAATCELAIVNMNIETRRTAAWSAAQTEILHRLRAAHAEVPVPPTAT